MSKFSFDFNIDRTGVCKVSISKQGIIFSKEAIEALGFPKKVHIGLDKTKKVLGVCEASEESNIKTFDFASTEARRRWLRIQSKALVDEIGKTAKFTPAGAGVEFLARIEEDDGVKYLIVELNKK